MATSQILPLMQEAASWLGQARYKEAVRSFRRVLQIDPHFVDAHFGLADALLALGAWPEGFAHYEWRMLRPTCSITKYPLPLWQGQPLPEGRLLIQCEQGLGDSIQFSRYIRWATAQAGQSCVVCQPQLKPLFQSLYGVTQLLTTGDQIDQIAAWIPLLSLPRLHGSTPVNVPPPEDFLVTSSPPINKSPSNRKKIGLVWRSNKTDSATAANKNIPLAALRPLLELPEIHWVSLQQNMTPEEVQVFGQQYHGQMDSQRLACFTGTAEWMRELDLVITLDSAPAHLAGSVAKEAWILLGHRADWRWLTNRSDCPWYPRAKLFRCAEPQQWSGVIDTVRGLLSQRIGGEGYTFP